MLALGRGNVLGAERGSGVGFLPCGQKPTGTLRCPKDQGPRQGLPQEPLARGSV